MKHRYEWVSGPRLVVRHERHEWHAGKSRLIPKGPAVYLFEGQVRDRDLGLVLNWAVSAPKNPINVNLAHDEYAATIPKAHDWTPQRVGSVKAEPMPRRWTPAPVGAEFVQGLAI